MSMFRSFRRKRILSRYPLPDEVWVWLLREHPILAGLDADEDRALRELTTLFLREKIFEAPKGIDLTEDRRAVIAVQACLPILHLGLDWYRNWRTVVVVPEEFTSAYSDVDPAGVVHEWEDTLGGESWDRGPLVVSWEDVESSGWGDGYNVVIHEAAHKLDLLDGEMNGRPALLPGMDPLAWQQVFSAAYEDFRSAAGETEIDSYAAESPDEFFAVASEYFFERPAVLRGRYGEVYRLLCAFYGQDPGRRLRA